MITVEKKEQIRRAHEREGKSIRQIQRETGYHRDTIRKALEDGDVPHYHLQEPRPGPVLDPVKPIIDRWLDDDVDQPPKQRHTAKRIYERLKTEYHFQGGASTVRRYVGQRRRALRHEVFIPLEYPPGHYALADFGEAQVRLAGELGTVHLFCLRLGYSKMPFVTALPSQSQEAFFEGHARGFARLGGIPQVIVYDNLKAAVKRILEGRSREEQAAFIAFRSHYLFESQFCTPYQGHEKGLVEGLVGYARRNWLVPVPTFATWDDLNEYLWGKCLEERPRRLRGMEQTIGEAYAQERDQLMAFPARRFPCCTMHPVQPNSFGLVTFQTNRYSIPAEQSYKSLWLRAFVDRVEITDGREVLAVHPRSYGREQDIFNPLHYLPLLEQRPGAWEQAKPISQWRKTWPPIYDQYLAALRERLSRPLATREFVRILRLHEDYPEAVIVQALEQALVGRCYNADGVKQLVLRLTEPTIPPARLDLSARWGELQVTWPDAGQFDQLLRQPQEVDHER